MSWPCDECGEPMDDNSDGICYQCIAEACEDDDTDEQFIDSGHIESSDCWCCPRLEYKDSETQIEVWVHNEKEDSH